MSAQSPGDGAPEEDDPYAPTAARLAHLATFPEQNPNAVIELSMNGDVTYLNPEALERFPELVTTATRHPLLAGALNLVDEFRRGGHDFAQREIEFEGDVFEQKVCYSAVAGGELIRIYSHDVTAHRRTETALAELARRVVDVQEQERKRVSRELHDEAGQAMTALKISLQLVLDAWDGDRSNGRDRITEAIELVDSTRERIRLLAHDLRPPALEALGIHDTLEDMCAEFSSRTGLAIAYVGEQIAGLSDAQEICLYRFVQEALANVAVHSHATKADVTLTRAPGTVMLTVSDNGRGIQPGQLESGVGSGIGMVGMRERIEMLGGTFEVNSMTSGLTLVATIPSRSA